MVGPVGVGGRGALGSGVWGGAASRGRVGGFGGKTKAPNRPNFWCSLRVVLKTLLLRTCNSCDLALARQLVAFEVQNAETTFLPVPALRAFSVALDGACGGKCAVLEARVTPRAPTGWRSQDRSGAQRPSWAVIGRCGSQGAGHCRCWKSVWREACWGQGDVADAPCAGSTALACRCQHDRRRLAQARSLTAGPDHGPPGPDRGLGRPEPSRQQAVGGLAGDGLDRLENLAGRPDAATA